MHFGRVPSPLTDLRPARRQLCRESSVAYPSGGFADLLWKGNVLVEMKSKFTTPTLSETD